MSTKIARYIDGVVPEPPAPDELDEPERRLMDVQRAALAEMGRAVAAIAPHEALRSAWRFVRAGNAYVEEVAPWALAKDPDARRRLEVVLYHLADALRLMALMVYAAIPNAASELWRRLGHERPLTDHRLSEDCRWGDLAPGSKVSTGAPLFPRIEADS